MTSHEPIKRDTGRTASGLMSALVCAFAVLALSACSDALLSEMKRASSESISPKKVSPANLSTMTAHETITIEFPMSMNPDDVVVAGDIGIGASKWETTTLPNDTLVLNKTNLPVWNKGPGKKLTLTVTNDGETSVFNYTYTVFYGTCVNGASGKGDDSNKGTVRAPVATVQKGIDRAQEIYASDASEVRVAQISTNPLLNKYAVDCNGTGAPVATMVEGISLYGAYSQDFSTRDVVANETVLVDISSAGGTAPFSGNTLVAQPNRAVFFPSGITRATVIDGFTVMPGEGKSNSAITCCDSSPTIQHVVIKGAASYIGSANDTYVIGMYAFHASGLVTASPLISDCTIDPGWTSSGSSNCFAIGIGLDTCAQPVVQNSNIKAGRGPITVGLYCVTGVGQSSASSISGNAIDCGADMGSGGVIHCGIYFDMTHMVDVTTNIFTSSGGATAAWGICENRTTAQGNQNPHSVHNNIFHTSGNAFGLYFDNATTSVTNLTTAVTTEEGSQTLAYWGNSTD
jgi:hypothetical protein